MKKDETFRKNAAIVKDVVAEKDRLALVVDSVQVISDELSKTEMHKPDYVKAMNQITEALGSLVESDDQQQADAAGDSGSDDQKIEICD